VTTTFSPADIASWSGRPLTRAAVTLPGYRGIWFTLGFQFEYGDKYSGGLGTYTANHQPMAVHSPEANRTYFTYGGALQADGRELAIMVSFFDHATGRVPRPVVLYLDPEVDDPHDNAAIQLDREGYVWVFKSGRGVRRPGLIFRSAKPHDLSAFDLVEVQEFTYPQIRFDDQGGFFLLFTKYTVQSDRGPARKLFWKRSPDRKTWSDDTLLAGFEGHYQTSGQHRNKVVTFFNWHPESNVDRRTNLYFAQTTDWGRTWTTANGQPLALPLDRPDNAARVIDYQSRGKCMYTCDVNFDAAGNPVLLYLTSQKGEPGPAGDPREWTLLHWKNGRWNERVIARSDHNYDMGSLFIDGPNWTVIGPTETGPQRYGTGGEMAVWTSPDEGVTWKKETRLTRNSARNHSYARRPEAAAAPFRVFWADGDPTRLSESHLYFSDGRQVWQLPYEMSAEWEVPAIRSVPE